MTARKTLWKGRRGRFVWHVYTPRAPGRISVHHQRKSPPIGRRTSFSLRWVIGWVLW